MFWAVLDHILVWGFFLCRVCVWGLCGGCVWGFSCAGSVCGVCVWGLCAGSVCGVCVWGEPHRRLRCRIKGPPSMMGGSYPFREHDDGPFILFVGSPTFPGCVCAQCRSSPCKKGAGAKSLHAERRAQKCANFVTLRHMRRSIPRKMGAQK